MLFLKHINDFPTIGPSHCQGSSSPDILLIPLYPAQFFLFSKAHQRESEVAQSCPTLCYPMDCSLPGFSVHGIFQARVLEWGAIAFSEGLPTSTKMLMCVPYLSKFSSVTQSCPTHCDPMNHSTPDLPVHHQLPESTQTHVH